MLFCWAIGKSMHLSVWLYNNNNNWIYVHVHIHTHTYLYGRISDEKEGSKKGIPSCWWKRNGQMNSVFEFSRDREQWERGIVHHCFGLHHPARTCWSHLIVPVASSGLLIGHLWLELLANDWTRYGTYLPFSFFCSLCLRFADVLPLPSSLPLALSSLDIKRSRLYIHIPYLVRHNN